MREGMLVNWGSGDDLNFTDTFLLENLFLLFWMGLGCALRLWWRVAFILCFACGDSEPNR
jgi:hypothetical protein